MAKMGKVRQPKPWLTPEELARNKMLMRERDRDRKRLKRMNPEYRKAEQERDRDRKKARRANEAFRQLEKLREKIRKERKKGNIIDEAALTAELVNNLPTVPVEPEIIVPDSLPHEKPTAGTGPSSQQQQVQTQNNNHSSSAHNNVSNIQQNGNNSSSNNHNTSNNNRTTNLTVPQAGAMTSVNTPSGSSANNHNNNLIQSQLAQAAHAMPPLNKGLLYPPPGFAHHPLPIPGVTLMPQLCHPILHQNLSATLYPPNGIKQEYNSEIPPPTSSPTGIGGSGTNSVQVTAGSMGNTRPNASNAADEADIPLIEPEIILQTSTDVIAAPHHFHNHAAAHTHHLHQTQCNMFQHMAGPQMHHMRALPLPTGGSHQPTAAHSQHHQQLQQHYAASKAAYESK